MSFEQYLHAIKAFCERPAIAIALRIVWYFSVTAILIVMYHYDGFSTTKFIYGDS